MAATFCLRLAFGMIASLLVVDPAPIPPRFFRVQFLATLGLLAVAAYFLWFHPLERVSEMTDTGRFDHAALWTQWTWITVAASIGICFLGCIVWHIDQSPGGVAIIRLTTVAAALVLFFATPWKDAERLDWWKVMDQFASAALLGTTTSAMLLGHSYLISPAMTMAPLRRMLMAGTVALALRVALALWGLWLWTAERPLATLDVETLLWLSARWLLGILAPLALGWMAWETARIRSTQSATGILYVVVIVCFLGELTSLLLLEKTGSVL
ncbi:MAG: hypothetical protein L0Y71_10860 [Gemmataceae bacterium]|nr:hypothetical protein [Gemmataceae bacterium]